MFLMFPTQAESATPVDTLQINNRFRIEISWYDSIRIESIAIREIGDSNLVFETMFNNQGAIEYVISSKNDSFIIKVIQEDSMSGGFAATCFGIDFEEKRLLLILFYQNGFVASMEWRPPGCNEPLERFYSEEGELIYNEWLKGCQE